MTPCYSLVVMRSRHRACIKVLNGLCNKLYLLKPVIDAVRPVGCCVVPLVLTREQWQILMRSQRCISFSPCMACLHCGERD